ncbi:expressed protein [Arabidopsis lyrata subsp. lyrata]|uniref:Expressed protein n=1 Tax=Arabidopsis lyrata subsp. lyrata TaxID=81972 RepID=D7L6E6_ARALL|nr:expressed protein [Arabidopsis lyrata subsp. lyrata]
MVKLFLLKHLKRRRLSSPITADRVCCQLDLPSEGAPTTTGKFTDSPTNAINHLLLNVARGI